MLDEDLNRIYEEEKERLGLSDVEIAVSFTKPSEERPRGLPLSETIENYVPKARAIYSRQICGGKKTIEFMHYEFMIDVDTFSDPEEFRKMCKHELYHIADGHCKRSKLTLKLLTSDSILAYSAGYLAHKIKYLLHEEPKAVAYEHGWVKPPKKKV